MEPVGVLAGPTAVGKTELSLSIARALDAEILNVDSRQLYRYMTIGTAKPTPAQRAAVPHHLLDLLAPDQPCNAAQFVAAGRQVLHDLFQRRKRVLIVAGSGLYLRALLYGLMPAPAAHEPLRQRLRALARRCGTSALHRRLQQVDPIAAATYHPHDQIRLIRALEVTYLTGEAFSAHVQRHRAQGPVYDYRGVVLNRTRAELYRRIDTRTDAMLAAGWLEEVDTLMARGYARGCAAMDSLGYRELLAYRAGQASWTATVEAIKMATRRFAKRQLTWFRKFPHVEWVNLSELQPETAVAHIVALLREPTAQPDQETLATEESAAAAPPMACPGARSGPGV